MKFKLSVDYSDNELMFLKEHNCEILSEIKLSERELAENEAPRRIFKYGGVFIAEIFDDESGCYIWAVMTKRKGKYRYSSCYDSLESLEQGL